MTNSEASESVKSDMQRKKYEHLTIQQQKQVFDEELDELEAQLNK